MSPFCFLSFNFFSFLLLFWRGYNSFIFSLLSFFLLTNSLHYFQIYTSKFGHSFILCSVNSRHRQRNIQKKMFDVSTLFLFLYINTSWRELRLARKFVMILLSSSIGQHTYNVSFLFFLPVYTHKYKTMKYLFCFVIYNVNGIFFSLMFCHFYDAFFFVNW